MNKQKTTLKSFKHNLIIKLENQIKIEHEALKKAKESMFEFGGESSCIGSENIGFREGRIRLVESLLQVIKEGRI